MKNWITLMLALFSAATVFAQSKATRNLQESVENERSLYLYESTLRALNADNNAELAKLIEGVEKVTVVMINKSEDEKPVSHFKTLVKDLESEGYEEMMTVNGPESRFGWYVVNGNDPESFVAVMEEAGQFFLFDLQGKLDLSLITSLEKADMSQFLKLLDKDDKQKAKK